MELAGYGIPNMLPGMNVPFHSMYWTSFHSRVSEINFVLFNIRARPALA
jgi:hypothetical protein